jgi:hypothetical protein
VACDVGDYAEAVAALKKHGISILMGGSRKVDTYAYMDTEKDLGAIVDIYKRPTEYKRTAPEATYPLSA